MPTYPYSCPACGHRTEQARPITNRDDPITCPDCGTLLKRRPVSTLGLLASRKSPPAPGPDSPPTSPASSTSPPKQPGATFINCAVINTAEGGAAIAVSDGEHLQARNLAAGTNRGPAFKLDTGGTVDADGVHHSTANHTPPKQKTPPNKRPRRPKRK